MSGSEFAFLAMGLLLGIAAGAALVEVLRARPPAPREVRVTVAQDAIPRRASTLSDDAFASAQPEPARGGPADRRQATTRPNGGVERRTPVQAHLVPAYAGPSVAIPIRGGSDPMLQAIQAGERSTATTATRVRALTMGMAGPAATAVLEAPTASATAVLDPPAAPAAMRGAGSSDLDRPADPLPGAEPAGSVADTGPCGELRRVAGERCELATRARSQATDAEEALRAAQRTFDEHEARAEAAARGSDARAIREAKDLAQRAFREQRDRAATTEAVEAAARDWLAEINRINLAARDAEASVAREREAGGDLAGDLERRALAVDAARIAAETAEAACLAARETAADCVEHADAVAAAQAPIADPVDDHGVFTADPLPTGALGAGGTPRIFRLLRGDRAAMAELVAALGGDDPDARRRWQLTLSDLVDAILAESIGASTLQFPDDHPFWSPFTLAQARDISRALASLGYRFDGLGGWVDGRMPSQRDLSLALGYAGLDPMRIRRWPNEEEMRHLFAEVTVAADEHLAGTAGDLTLGELVSLLGRRADGLAELWNEWGRVRPLLLDES